MIIIKAITLRMSDKLHKRLKYHLVEKDLSIQQYIISLIKKDIGMTDDEDDLSDYILKK